MSKSDDNSWWWSDWILMDFTREECSKGYPYTGLYYYTTRKEKNNTIYPYYQVERVLIPYTRILIEVVRNEII